METVLFDLLHAQPIQGTKYHGGGEYIKSVFYALAFGFSDVCRIEVFFDHSAFLDDWILTLIREKHIIAHDLKSVLELGRVFSAHEGAIRLFTGMPYGYSSIQFPANVTAIGVFHGLRGLEKPYDRYAWMYSKSVEDVKEFIRQTAFTRWTHQRTQRYFCGLIKKFDVVLTDSLHSAYSMKVAFPEVVQSREIKVFYAPSKRLTTPGETLPDDVKASGRYIVLINANRWIKNSCRAVRVLDGLYEMDYLKGIKTRVYGNLPARIAEKRSRIRAPSNFLTMCPRKNWKRATEAASYFFTRP